MKIGFTTVKKLAVASSLFVLTPIFVTHAQKLKDINDVSRKFTDLGNTFLGLLVAFAFIWIIFNVVRYLIVGADSEDQRKLARQSIIWGIIGLAIILSIWGIVNIVTNTFQFQDNNAPTGQFPCIPERGTTGCTPRTGTTGSGASSGFGQPTGGNPNGLPAGSNRNLVQPPPRGFYPDQN